MDAAASAVQLPGYVPLDVTRITSYREGVEVVRSSRLVREECPASQVPFIGTALSSVDPTAHIARRRALNVLTSTEVLEEHRQHTVDALCREFSTLAAGEQPAAPIDLVQFTRRILIGYAAAVLGAYEPSSEAVRRSLLDQLETIARGHHAKWATATGHAPEWHEALKERAALRDELIGPAVEACPFSTGGSVGARAATLVDLAAMRADPTWADLDVVTADALVLLMGLVHNSANTIVHATNEMLGWLASNPEARQLRDLGFMANALQESMRLHPSLPQIGRLAREDVTLASGRRIAAGEWVAVIPRLANVDEDVFGEDASSFDPRREVPPGVPRYGLTLGTGAHQCLGLKMILGSDGSGHFAHILRAYFTAGIAAAADEGCPRFAEDVRLMYESFPVTFSMPDRGVEIASAA
jgi:cytochrome P450